MSINNLATMPDNGIENKKTTDISSRGKQQPPLRFKCFFCGLDEHKRYQTKEINESLHGEYGEGMVIWNCKGCGASYRVRVNSSGIANFEILRSEKLKDGDISKLLNIDYGEEKKEVT